MNRASATPVKAATSRTFHVLWYEVQRDQAIIRSTGERIPVAKPVAKKRRQLEVEARTLGHAKLLARKMVESYGVAVLSVNFTTRPGEIIVYSKESP